MKTVYYYDGDGKFSNVEIVEGVSVLYIMRVISTSFSQGDTIEKEELSITKYFRRYGSPIYIATRNEFEAKCLIKNHIDLDYHAEIICDKHQFTWNKGYTKSVHEDLRDKLLREYNFKNLVPSVVIDEYTPHSLKVSLYI